MSNQNTSIDRFRKLRRMELAIATVLVVALIALFSTAHADVTFGASVTNANGELSTTLTWDAPGASGCIGAGHSSWEGEKAASGTQALPAITLSGTYQLTLTCSLPGDTTARVSWTNPTQNTDGTSYTNPQGTRILYGRSADALTQAIEVSSPSATSYLIEGLDPGQWFFGAKAYSTTGAESILSNVASKTITGASSEEASVSLTVNPVPQAPAVEVE